MLGLKLNQTTYECVETITKHRIKERFFNCYLHASVLKLLDTSTGIDADVSTLTGLFGQKIGSML